MQYVRSLLFVALVLLPAALAPGETFAATPRPADQVFRLSAHVDEKGGLDLNWSIAPGTYLYRDKITATLNGKPLKLSTEHGELKDDPTFGPIEIYRAVAQATVIGSALPKSGEIRVSYQGCAENIVCYPPITKAIDLQTLAIAEPALDGGGVSRAERVTSNDVVPHDATFSPVSEDAAARASFDDSYISMLAAFLGFGLLLAFTPCVFPMIPILSGMLARSGEGLSLARSLVLSGTYVVAMASAYGVLGVFAAWSGENLQAALQTPWAIALMSAVFLVLALSMFGLFELRLPQAWSSKLAGAAAKRGSVGGAAVLGFGSALIVGPCVTPPLAAALVFVAQGGDPLRGSSALFAFGLGMGLPLLAFGVLGAKALPRSGPWLLRINRAFGFIFVGIAIWMASRVLPLALVAASWGLFFICLGVYVDAPRLLSAPRLRSSRDVIAAAGLVALAYGGVLVAGATSAMYGPLRPLDALGLIARSEASGQDIGDFTIVSNESALDAAIAAARSQGRTVMIDFSADWCTECKVMERAVFAETTVRQRLHDLVLIRADLTHFDESSKKLMRRFAVVGPPTIIFLNPAGVEIADARSIGTVGVDGFLSKIAKAVRG